MTMLELFEIGIGRKLTFLGRAADMLSVSLEENSDCQYAFVVHIHAPSEIIFQGEHLTGRDEMYDGENGMFNSTFDIKIERFMRNNEKPILQKISVDDRYNLHVFFSNGLEIHSKSLAPEEFNPDPEYNDLWWVFLNWCATSTFIGYPNGVEELPPSDTQEQLDRRKEESIQRHKQGENRLQQ